jgi:hypothetical protein
VEMKELLEEYAGKKKTGLDEIKKRFNELSAKVNIDAMAIQEALKISLQARVNFTFLLN